MGISLPYDEMIVGPFPLTRRKDNKTSRYIRTFCAGCKKSDMSAEKIGHDECPGPVLYIHEVFDHSSANNAQKAMSKVNGTISNLQNNQATFDELCGPYVRMVKGKSDDTQKIQ